jgi:hypothetical protein
MLINVAAASANITIILKTVANVQATCCSNGEALRSSHL